ncbi:hypothetical protein CAEBREN_13241 [Caenorhabditis brenneri]|uniref:Protection of telomeres protein 1 ssDNA-binding domain-containing protein n=1 Tax=Caenorhabditis brenneri TaxID=135651 RepID=G0NGA9_CAEBE|nr:hypothetical protein CAEBREN_13241 [Caenorhabditis brenneri]
METKLSASDFRRIKDGHKFNDETYYLQWRRYMDLIAQVHSVVLTQRGTYVLKCWRGTKFGPANKAMEVESRLFRVNQDCFKEYIVSPDPRIANAVEKLGRECLLEIVVYDEHISVLDSVKSGDFVALQNVHGYVNGSLVHTLTIHGGDGMGRNRGITIIPKDYNQPEFLYFKARIDAVLHSVTVQQFLPQKPLNATEEDADGKSKKDGLRINLSVKPAKQIAFEDSTKRKRFIWDVKDDSGASSSNNVQTTEGLPSSKSALISWKPQEEQELSPILFEKSTTAGDDSLNSKTRIDSVTKEDAYERSEKLIHEENDGIRQNSSVNPAKWIASEDSTNKCKRLKWDDKDNSKASSSNAGQTTESPFDSNSVHTTWEPQAEQELSPILFEDCRPTCEET